MISKITLVASVAGLIMFLAIFTGCGNDNNPLSAFEPEIVNNADAFQFQVTNASNVATTVTYNWNNTATAATIDHSTATTSGSARVTVFDADSSQVYSSLLKASGVEESTAGTAGQWTIIVTFNDYDGTANFRLEKLTK